MGKTECIFNWEEIDGLFQHQRAVTDNVVELPTAYRPLGETPIDVAPEDSGALERLKKFARAIISPSPSEHSENPRKPW